MYKKWYKKKTGKAIDDRTMSVASGGSKLGFKVTVGPGASEKLINHNN